MCKPSKVFDLKLGKVTQWLKHQKELDQGEGKALAAAGQYPGMGRP